MALVLIIVGIVVLLAIVVWFVYNRTVARRNAVDNSWAQIETALQRRHDLIPNLVEAVKGYAKHERDTFEQVTKARSGALAAQAPPSQAVAEDGLTAAIGRLMVVAEQYPELRATENFQQLQGQLEETETKIAVSRQVYNDAVLTYDTALETVPTNIVGNLFSFQAREYFEVEEPAAREAPRVQF